MALPYAIFKTHSMALHSLFQFYKVEDRHARGAFLGLANN